MGRWKVDPAEVQQLWNRGLNQTEIAQKCGVNKSSVCRLLKRFDIAKAKDVVLRTAQRVADRKLDSMEQLHEINEVVLAELRHLREALDGAEDSEKREGLELRILRHTREIRGQLGLLLDIARQLYDVEQVASFQQAVLEEIAEVDPDVRKKIVSRLQARRIVSGFAQPD